jgi:hypothetical protein
MSSKANKIQRQNKVEARKEAEEALTKQVGMFGLLPDECNVCHSPFDKKSKEMAQTWIVVVRHEEKLVRLFCPQCVDKVKEFLPDENEEA